MKDFKLHLEKPEAFQDQDDWNKVSEKIMEVLKAGFNMLDEDFLCGTLLGEMYSNRELRDISCMALESDWPGQVLQIATLRLHGNGPCPNCGCSQAIEHTGGFERDEYDRLMIYTTGYTCIECGKEYAI